MNPSQIPFPPGDILLGKYRVESMIGKGGAGLVMAVRHTELDELYAIKVLLPQSLEDEEAVNRFTREARTSVRLKGEHVVRVHDVGRLENGAPYMLMEHLKGKDLKKVVRERGPLPLEEAIFYLLQTCEAIREAHDLGIIHRDLKPSNLFLTFRPNGTPCVKVLDFGISKQLSGRQSLDLTKTDTVLGSPYYMSPEQMARSRDADARSDIWALGCVFYELLTGTVPFEGDTLTEIVAAVLQEDPKPPSSLRPGLPPSADALILRCLQRKPDARFQTIAELAQALSDLLSLPSVSSQWSADWGSMSSVRMRLGTWTGAPLPPPPPPSALAITNSPPDFRPAGSAASHALQEPEPIGVSTRSAWGATFQRLLNTRKKHGTRLAVLALIILAATSFFVSWIVLRSADDDVQPSAAASTESAAPVLNSATPLQRAGAEASANPQAATSASPASSAAAPAPQAASFTAPAVAPKTTRPPPVVKKKHEGIF